MGYNSGPSGEPHQIAMPKYTLLIFRYLKRPKIHVLGNASLSKNDPKLKKKLRPKICPNVSKSLKIVLAYKYLLKLYSKDFF